MQMNWDPQKVSPHACGGSWLQSFLSLQPSPGTVWNFYFSVFVCKGEAWASLHNFHSMRPERGSAQVFWGGMRESWEPWGCCHWQEARWACFSERQRERSMAALSIYCQLLCVLAATHALTYQLFEGTHCCHSFYRYKNRGSEREGTCPRSHSWKVAESGFKPRSVWLQICDVNHCAFSVFFPNNNNATHRNNNTTSIQKAFPGSRRA